MRQMDVTEKKIGDHSFYIRPFPAFVSANLSGEIAALVVPVIGALTPLAKDVNVGGTDSGNDTSNDTGFNIENIDLEEAGPAFGNAVSSLSGDKIESLMKKLLINSGNVSVSGPITGDQAKILTLDLANEVFCGEIQDLYTLCWEVIKLNFGGFFKKLGSRFGNPLSVLRAKTTTDSEN